MAGTLEPLTARSGVTFEVERVEVEDDRLVVSGRWYGVRGMRFVRPALVIGGRQVLATLEHKPWAPDAGEPWTAAFPWHGGDVDLSEVVMAVAPSVTVPLAPAAEDLPVTVAAAADVDDVSPAQAAAQPHDDVRLHRLETEVRFLRDELRTRTQERDALRRTLEDARTAVADRDDLDRTRAAAERERDAAIAQRDEAVRDREAAVRTRRRMEAQLEEALRARQAAEAERDQALTQLGEARAQRDEVLVAHRALRRHVDAERAGHERARPAHAAPRPAANAPAPDRPREEPLGVRAIPAARTVAADLERSQPDHGEVSKFDLWAIRFFGSVAAISFILLLVMLLRVFV